MSFDLQVNNGDLVLKNGDFALVKGNAKLEQDLLKIALTAVGAEPLQPWYGSLVSKSLVGSFLKSDMIFGIAKTQLTNAITTLKNLQNLQVSTGQKVTPDEQISAISNISITRSPTDPRLIGIVISVLDRTFSKVAASFSVTD